jgi:hypothetical protein
VYCHSLWHRLICFNCSCSFGIKCLGCNHSILFIVFPIPIWLNWCTPKFFDGLNCESKGEDNERKRSWGAFLGSQHFGGRGACWSFKMGLGRLTSNSIIHMDLHKPNKLVSA